MNKESFTDISDYCLSGTLISVIKQDVEMCFAMLHWFYSEPCMGVCAGKLCSGHHFLEKLQVYREGTNTEVYPLLTTVNQFKNNILVLYYFT